MKSGEKHIRWYIFEDEEEYLEFINFIGNCLDLWDYVDIHEANPELESMIQEIGEYADKFTRGGKK